MNEIRLDFLQNPPLDRELCEILTSGYNFSNIATKEDSTRIESFREKLTLRFGKENASAFSFSIGGFLELFANFKEIYFTPSLHYEIRRAIEIATLHTKTQQIELENLEQNLATLNTTLTSHGVKKSEILIILPLINEDIFSPNDFLKNISFSNATLALDVSYSLALGENLASVESSKKSCVESADILVINSAPLGLPCGFGAIISNQFYTSNLHKMGVSEAIFNAIIKRESWANNIKQNGESSLNLELYERLREYLGDNIGLFSDNFALNTLPLRFREINTRNLIQHLYLDNIYLQSSQECYLGFIKPSHTLLSLGFGNLRSRELCAISFDKITDMPSVAEKIAKSYEIIRMMEF